MNVADASYHRQNIERIVALARGADQASGHVNRTK